MRKRKFSKNEIEDFVKNSKTYADVCRKCGWDIRIMQILMQQRI